MSISVSGDDVDDSPRMFTEGFADHFIISLVNAPSVTLTLQGAMDR